MHARLVISQDQKDKALRKQKEQERQEEESKHREQSEKKKLAREAALDQAVNEWTNHVIPNWESKKHAARARDLVFKMGIPPKLRGQVWPLAIGNALMIGKELFDIFAAQARNARLVKKAYVHVYGVM